MQSIAKMILVITQDRYPDGDAGAVRTHYLVKLFRELGYTALVIGMGPSTGFRIQQHDLTDYISFRD